MQAVAEVPEDWALFNNTSRAILAVAESMMEGETTFHRGGNDDAAFAHLREGYACVRWREVSCV